MLTLLCAVQDHVNQLNDKSTYHPLACPTFCYRNIGSKLLQNRKEKTKRE